MPRPRRLSLQLPPWQERSTWRAQRDVPLRRFLGKSIKAQSANSPSSVNVGSAMQVHWICSTCSAKRSLVWVFFARENIHYQNSFSVVTALAHPDFADSPRGSCRRSKSKINAHLLPSQQKNFFENSVS